jgi:hypothetical protein
MSDSAQQRALAHGLFVPNTAAVRHCHSVLPPARGRNSARSTGGFPPRSEQTRAIYDYGQPSSSEPRLAGRPQTADTN